MHAGRGDCGCLTHVDLDGEIVEAGTVVGKGIDVEVVCRCIHASTTLNCAAIAIADIDVLDVGFVDVPVNVGDFDVVVHQLVCNACERGVVQIGNDLWQNEKVHVAVARHIACGHVGDFHGGDHPFTHPSTAGVGFVDRVVRG